MKIESHGKLSTTFIFALFKHIMHMHKILTMFNLLINKLTCKIVFDLLYYNIRYSLEHYHRRAQGANIGST